MSYIYKITNNINNKIYIGKTYLTIEKRWKEHCHDSTNRDKEARPLYRAMNKYGIENFSIQVVEEVENGVDLEEREKFWIQYYDSYKNGYNATIGGDGRSYIDYSLIISYWNEGKLLKEICSIMNIDAKTARKVLRLYNISTEEARKRASLHKSKKVKRIDKDGNFMIYSSITDAYNSVNVNYSTHIQEVCNGKRRTAYGYTWEWCKE